MSAARQFRPRKHAGCPSQGCSTPPAAAGLYTRVPIGPILRWIMNRLVFSLMCLAVIPGFPATKESSLPLFFVQNGGMVDASVRYIVETAEMKAAFASDSATFRIHGEQVQVRFEGANRNVVLEGIEPLAARANFFIGQDPREWHTGVPTFQKILYRNL